MNCTNPIFVVGAPRSGTTLLRSMLDAHPSICCPTWETGVFEKFESIVGGDVNIHFATDRAMPIDRQGLIQWCRRSFDDLMHQLTQASGKPRWAEKTPAHVFHMKLIHEVYPDCQFIHILRDGREVVRSLQNMEWAPRKIRWSCQRWVDSVRAGRQVGAQLPPNQYTELQYERLIKEPEKVIRSLCDFLNEPYLPQILEFHEPDNNSFGVGTKPLASKPINKHRELGLYERFLLQRIAGPLLRDLGYD